MPKRAGLAQHLRRAARGVEETLVPRWVPYLFAVFSLALAPGIARVFASAPPLHLAMHWRLAWGGFDVALAALLAATGLALFRRSALAEVLAAMTATLLCCDAWLDVLSSAGQGRSATVAAIGEAALVELPLAALFTWVAVRFASAVAEARPGSCYGQASGSASAAWCPRPGVTRPCLMRRLRGANPGGGSGHLAGTPGSRGCCCRGGCRPPAWGLCWCSFPGPRGCS